MCDRSTIALERRCIECGRVIGGSAIFCPWCGMRTLESEPGLRSFAVLKLDDTNGMCLNCGNTIHYSFRFCDKCGFQIRKKADTSK